MIAIYFANMLGCTVYANYIATILFTPAVLLESVAQLSIYVGRCALVMSLPVLWIIKITLHTDDSTLFVALFVEWFSSDSSEVQLALRHVYMCTFWGGIYNFMCIHLHYSKHMEIFFTSESSVGGQLILSKLQEQLVVGLAHTTNPRCV